MENASGETSVLGVTAEHPLYDAAVGWTPAGELVAGNVDLDAMLEPLTVLALRVDDTPQLVHNLEIGGAIRISPGRWRRGRMTHKVVFI